MDKSTVYKILTVMIAKEDLAKGRIWKVKNILMEDKSGDCHEFFFFF